MEDAGSGDYMNFSPNGVNILNPKGRRFWAWAEPDNAFHVDQLVNNSAAPRGVPPACPWTRLNRGPNREVFRFHPGGVNVILCDGSAPFLRESISGTTYRAFLTPDSGDLIGGDF